MRKRPLSGATVGVRWAHPLESGIDLTVAPGFIEVLVPDQAGGHTAAPGRSSFLAEFARDGGPVIPHAKALNIGAFPDRATLETQREIAHLMNSPLASLGIRYAQPLTTRSGLDSVVEGVRICQDVLDRPVAVTHNRLGAQGELPESAALNELVQRTGCWLAPNITSWVRHCVQLQACPLAVVDALPMDHVAFLRVTGPADGSQLSEHLLQVLRHVWLTQGPVPVLARRPTQAIAQLDLDLLHLTASMSAQEDHALV